jgi:hypothetical protein
LKRLQKMIDRYHRLLELLRMTEMSVYEHCVHPTRMSHAVEANTRYRGLLESAKSDQLFSRAIHDVPLPADPLVLCKGGK